MVSAFQGMLTFLSSLALIVGSTVYLRRQRAAVRVEIS